jgi:hypothetical protein
MLLSLLAAASAYSACGNETGTAPSNGTGGGGPAGGAAGDGGSADGGGAGATGTGGSNGGTGGSGTGGSSDGGAPGSGGSPGTGGSEGTGGAAGSASACDYTPQANAGQAKLTFNQITLMGVATDVAGKESDGKGFGREGITEIRFLPGSNDEFLLMQKGGRVNHMKLAGADATTATLIKSFDVMNVSYGQDCGLLSLAFDPGFATNHFIYFGHCDTQSSTKLERYTLMDDTLSDPVDIMTWKRVSGTNAWHTIGSMGFDAAGNLWILHGEFTGGKISQSLDSNLGKVLRMVPSRTPGMGGYEPAPGNPYATEAKPKSAVWAWGFRSPWRAFMNSHGHIVVGDVGDHTDEEVNVVTEPGKNFGWNTTSGPCNGDCVSPVTYWRGGGNEDKYASEGNPVTSARAGRAVWVGTEYGNCGNDRYGGALTGVTIFGDFFAGWVRGMVLDNTGKATVDKSLGHLTVVSTWTQGPDGYLYVGTYGGPYDSAASAKDITGMFRAVLSN